MDGEAAGAAGSEAVSLQGSHSWQLHGQGLDEAESSSFARAAVGEFPGREAGGDIALSSYAPPALPLQQWV